MPIDCDHISIDQITYQGQFIVTIIIIALQAVIGVVVCYNLLKLCRESFSYRKDGINQTIEFNVVCLATIITIILARASEIWLWNFRNEDDWVYERIKNFSSLLGEISVIFVNDIYLYGAVVWLRMVYDTEKKEKFQRLMKIIKIGGVYIANPLIMISLLGIHIYLQDNDPVKPKYTTPALSIVLASTIVVQIVFVYACVKLFKYSEDFELPSNRCVNKFKVWLKLIIIASIIRTIVFILELVAFQTELRLRSGDCKNEDIPWTIVMLLYVLLMSIMPIAIFLLLFKFNFNSRRHVDINSSHLLLHSQSEII